MLGAIRNAKRVVQMGKVQYDPNIYKLLFIPHRSIEHDESDDIEKVKVLSKKPREKK